MAQSKDKDGLSLENIKNFKKDKKCSKGSWIDYQLKHMDKNCANSFYYDKKTDKWFVQYKNGEIYAWTPPETFFNDLDFVMIGDLDNG